MSLWVWVSDQGSYFQLLGEARLRPLSGKVGMAPRLVLLRMQRLRANHMAARHGITPNHANGNRRLTLVWGCYPQCMVAGGIRHLL